MAKDRNYAPFWAILKKMPGADKEAIVLQYTNGRTTSLKEMTDQEYRLMITALRCRVADGERLRAERSATLHQLQRYGIDTTDWGEVNRFCAQSRIAGKVFAKITIAEHIALQSKMRAIIAKEKRKERQDEIDRYNQQVAASACNTQLPS